MGRWISVSELLEGHEDDAADYLASARERRSETRMTERDDGLCHVETCRRARKPARHRGRHIGTPFRKEPVVYDPSEQDEIIDEFVKLLRSATKDGGRKRAAGEKPSWKVDPDHEPAIFSHLSRWKHGELVDPDSGAHPLVHLAWRALAIAWQEIHGTKEGA